MAIPVANSVPLLTSSDNNNGSLTEEFISGLAQGSSWTFSGPRVLTYSLNINDDGVSYPDGPPEPGEGGPWSERPDMAAAVALALEAWADVADIDIQLIDSGEYYFESAADLAITLTGDDLDIPGFEVIGLAHFPDPDYVDGILSEPHDNADRTSYPAPEGDAFFDNFNEQFDFIDPGGVGFTAILHELGHALGLKHPSDDGGSGRPVFDDLGINAMDHMRHTVMSSEFAFLELSDRGFSATPMPLDILAIQHIYGANMSHRIGDDSYELRVDTYSAVWDAGGTDTFSAAEWTGPNGVVIDLREGEFSGNRIGPKRTAIAYGATIEEAIGSDRADRLIGNGAGNSLAGGAGNDTLTGGGGNDRLGGGAGGDVLKGNTGNDILVWGGETAALYDGGAQIDTLKLTGGDLNLAGLSGTTIIGTERINLSGGGDNTLTLSEQDVLNLSSTTDTLVVLGGAGDAVDITDSFTVGALAGGFRTYSVGAATLLIDSDIDVG